MDIYIIRKCKIEGRQFPGSNGAKYNVPVMMKEDLHSYVVRKALTSREREQIQDALERFHTKGGA